MRRKPAALRNIAIDLDSKPLAAFECDYPVEKIHGCAHRFLSDYAYGGRELVYCAPPYLHHTRSSSRQYRFDYDVLGRIKEVRYEVQTNPTSCSMSCHAH